MTAASSARPSFVHRLLRPCAIGLVWMGIAAFLICGGYWAFAAGLSLREQLWEQSSTIRFHFDIHNAFNWGDQVLRYAEKRAGLPNRADVLADNPKAGQDPDLRQIPPRRLTYAELVDGWVHFYQYHLDQDPNLESELDYPPMRLAVMTLWVRHAQREHPALKHWPAPGRYTEPPPIHVYDFAKPLLLVNTGCAAASALAALALCWLWTVRHHTLRPWHFRAAASPAIIPTGLITFIISAAAFFYVWSQAIQPPPPPTPRIGLQSPEVSGRQMNLHGIIDAEGLYTTTWRFQWGATADYTQASRWQSVVGDFESPRPVSRLVNQSGQETFHYRLQARNYNGITSTDDQIYDPAAIQPAVSAPNQPETPSPRPAMLPPIFGGFAVGGIGLWIPLLIMLLIMLVSVRVLPPVHRGWACGAVAAMFIWFDPAILVDSHIWPQWDVWLLVFFIWAALAASLGAWEIAGLLLGIGTMFKGQLLMGVPILTLWPLFAGKPVAALRVLIGLACGAAIIVWPWMFNDFQLLHWTAGLILAALLIGAWMALAKRWAWYTLPVLVAVLTILFIKPFGGLANWLITPAICALVLFAWKWWLSRPRANATPFSSRWCRPLHIAATLAMAGFAVGTYVAGFFFDGDFAWYLIGFAYGAGKEDRMAMGAGSFANLPLLLKDKFNWDLHDVVGTINLPLGADWRHWLDMPTAGFDLPMRTGLVLINVLCVIACAAAAAVHSRRRDPRVLAALCAPWLVMPIVLGQMSERYLLWASGLSAMFICISAGWGLFHVLLALLAAGMTLHQLLTYDPGRWPHLYQLFTAFHRDGSILMVLLVIILMVGALTPGRRKEPPC